jgi:hypothetical protein
MTEYREMRLWADRVRLVHMYLEHPSKWPDGLDTNLNRWHSGHEAYWRERAGRLAAGGWEGGLDDEAAYRKWSMQTVRAAPMPREKVEPLRAVAKGLVEAHLGERKAGGRPKMIEGEPWVAEGISRRTWERRKAEDSSASQ